MLPTVKSSWYACVASNLARGHRARGDANSKIGYLLILANFVNFLEKKMGQIAPVS